MKIIDLSHEVYSDMPQRFPGPIPTIFDHSRRSSEHFQAVDDSSLIQHHLGTHLDAPRHYNPKEGMGVDGIPLESLYTEAILLNLTDKVAETELSATDLVEAMNKSHEEIQPNDGVLLFTGMAAKYSEWHHERMEESEYVYRRPWLSEDAVRWLLSRRISVLGIDALQPDAQGDYRPAHQILLRDNNIPIIENLCNLDKITQARVLFVALPPKFVGASGFPVRAIAIET